MGKSLQELGLLDEALPTAGQELDDLPEFGRWTPPPPPGQYRFKLPRDLSRIWDTFDTPDKTPPQRVKAQFDRDSPLLIVQSPENKHNGEPFETRLTNNERKRGKDGVQASDLDYLLKALGDKSKPRSNREYVQAVQRHAGEEFSAKISYRWACSRDREKRVKDENGQLQTIAGSQGCGATYYQEDATKNEDGSIPFEVTCSACGASLRAFTNLDNLRG